jgi:hypothetical protein
VEWDKPHFFLVSCRRCFFFWFELSWLARMSDNVKAQIILKEKHDQQEVALSPVHVYSSNAHDSR